MESWKHERRLLILKMLLVNNELHEKNKLKEKLKKLKTQRRIRAEEMRNEYNNFSAFLQEMRISKADVFYNYMRMTTQDFEELLTKIEPLIEKQSTNYKEAIPAAARLSLTLRYLITGDSMISIASTYGIGKSTVVGIIPTVCEAIWKVFSPNMFKPSAEKWLKISEEFDKKWNFPLCIGALDVKRIMIKTSRSDTKEAKANIHDNIILMALVSADFKFLIVDIGVSSGQNNDHIFENSTLGQMFHENEMDLPENSTLSEIYSDPMPHVMIAGELFDPDDNVMTPYPENTLSTAELLFNLRLNDAKRASENAFGILATRWGIYGNIMNVSTSKTEKIIKATICLHNFLMDRSQYCESGYADYVNKKGHIVDGAWRSNNRYNEALVNIRRIEKKEISEYAKNVKNYFLEYFINESSNF